MAAEGEPMDARMTLPTGTVTFLFTDIEGSTQLWEQHPEAIRAAVARHDTLLWQALEALGGSIFETAGDSSCAVFANPADVISAAVAALTRVDGRPITNRHGV
jgi:class 3 adenylate cyclase